MTVGTGGDALGGAVNAQLVASSLCPLAKSGDLVDGNGIEASAFATRTDGSERAIRIHNAGARRRPAHGEFAVPLGWAFQWA